MYIRTINTHTCRHTYNTCHAGCLTRHTFFWMNEPCHTHVLTYRHYEPMYVQYKGCDKRTVGYIKCHSTALLTLIYDHIKITEFHTVIGDFS